MKPWGTANINADNVMQLLSHGIRKTLQHAGYLLLLLYNNNNNNNHHLHSDRLHLLLFHLLENQGSHSFDYVYLQGIHLYQCKCLLAASVVNRKLSNMVSRVWSRFISAQSKSPSFSHKNFILHNTDCTDDISVPVSESGHYLDVSNIHTYTIKPAFSWDPFHYCSRSEASSF